MVCVHEEIIAGRCAERPDPVKRLADQREIPNESFSELFEFLAGDILYPKLRSLRDETLTNCDAVRGIEEARTVSVVPPQNCLYRRYQPFKIHTFIQQHKPGQIPCRRLRVPLLQSADPLLDGAERIIVANHL